MAMEAQALLIVRQVVAAVVGLSWLSFETSSAGPVSSEVRVALFFIVAALLNRNRGERPVEVRITGGGAPSEGDGDTVMGALTHQSTRPPLALRASGEGSAHHSREAVNTMKVSLRENLDDRGAGVRDVGMVDPVSTDGAP